jgi:hypothetical protein
MERSVVVLSCYRRGLNDCHGSGRLSKDLARRYNSPFAVETATFTLRNSDVVAEASRSLFDVVREYRESYDVYGTKMSFEWE